jgi:excinuclease ABC subunit A
MSLPLSRSRSKVRPPPPRRAGSASDAIQVRGARQNNLKGFDLDLPVNRLIVVTGPSGSGKSSLAFDTLYAEGQRRYVETFSPYTRQFLERMDKPRVDSIHGIPPAIAIEQANHVKSTRSTVGTITEINDYLKVLFPRVARGFCPSCGDAIQPDTARSIAEMVEREHAAETLLITFPIAVPAGEKPKAFFEFLQAQGYLRVWLNQSVIRVDEALPAALKWLPARVAVLQDRLSITRENRGRLSEAIETALRFGKGRVTIVETTSGREYPFSSGWHCPRCDVDIAAPTPGLFSFNHPQGACPNCRGFGRVLGIDLDRALPDKRRSIAQGLVKPFQSGMSAECQRDLLKSARREEIDVNCPFDELTKSDQDWVIYGALRKPKHSGSPTNDELWENGQWYGVRGYFDWLESKTYKMHVRVLLSRYRSSTPCPVCAGTRFQPATLNFRLLTGEVEGRKSKAKSQNGTAVALTLPEVAALPLRDLRKIFDAVPEPAQDPTGVMVLGEIRTRLRYLNEVGLGYLTLDRATRTLSGGEIERVNLTTCLGASLVNTLFVLDEPSVGLHPRDVGQLVEVMRGLRDKGNTLVVVEHEEAIVRAADHLVDLGPGRGELGGELVFNGTLEELRITDCGWRIEDSPPGAQISNLKSEIRFPKSASLTADYLFGRKTIPIPKSRRVPTRWLKIRGAREHNLREIDVDIPAGVLCCITGVSGSGKSTLVHDVLYQNLLRLQGQETGEDPIGRCREIIGADQFGTIVMVDQSPLARTPRSTPALYLGVYDSIRELFAATPEAQSTGLTPGDFSFNSGAGRCERCSGTGFEKIEMQFLSDLYVRCSECEGRRFQPHVLRVRLAGRSIHEFLEQTVTEGIKFLSELPDPSRRMRDAIHALGTLAEVGLGYLRLGQPLNTLSGGEAQRVKLVGHVVERARNPGGKPSLLIFDEPTTGLHFDDVAQLLRVFQRLVVAGESLIVVEHNLEVIKSADYLIDLGPEAGDEGGRLVAVGTPEEVATNGTSHTGRHLKDKLRTDRLRIADFGLRIGEGKSAAKSLVVQDRSPQYGNGTSSKKSEIRNPKSEIRIHGAREHNLKNLTLNIPREQMVVITGLSGSGKSTLAFDLLFAEGQRRFLDSMSPYARQFVEQLEKPDVDLVEGLPPTVAIEQRVTRGGGKSTVATVTEVFHFLRLLFAKLGTQYCPACQLPVEAQSQAAIVAQVEAAARKGRVRVLAPLVKARKGFHTEVATWAVNHGFSTLLVDDRIVPAEGFKKLARFKEHTIDVVIGEATAKTPNLDMRELVRRALEVGKGTARLLDARNRSTVLSAEMSCPKCGRAFEELDPRLFSFHSPHGWCEGCRGFGRIWHEAATPKLDDSASQAERELAEERASDWIEEGQDEECPSCHGARLNPVARSVRLQGRETIDAIARRPVREAMGVLDRLKFKGSAQIIAHDIIVEIRQRLSFMREVGLGYLELERSARTLSGGETQRIRLAAQLGSNLRGVLYVLDEPTIGLHPRDNAQLLDTLEALKAKGNSLVIVEHDEETMRRADHIIDLGPGAGIQGGEVIAQGRWEDILKVKTSATSRCLRHPFVHPMRGARRPLTGPWLELRGASANNLRGIDVRFAVGRLNVITGISGSGKSSLLHSCLMPAVQRAVTARKNPKAKIRNPKISWRALVGDEHLESVYEVDQSPIGKTSRSTPATYVGVLDDIRALFAQLPLARMRGYTASRFSFNVAGGRCESCGGHGLIKHEMAFLPTSYTPCDDCGGSRYNPQTNEVLYDGRSIGDVMKMNLSEAAEFFKASPRIARPLRLLSDTGLGYLQLGQSSPTLSGGEAQRLKLVTELTRGVAADQESRIRRRQQPRSTLYLLEEPTVGLHLADVEKLLEVIHRLVDDGGTVVVIEHHVDVIAEADHVIDIGPEAGPEGGGLVTSGTPEQVAAHKTSRIAPFLKVALAHQRRVGTTAQQAALQ